MTKISKKLFVDILIKNYGDYSKSSEDISKLIGINYTRQAVQRRVETMPEIMSEIKNVVVDKAKSVIFNLLNSKDERIVFDTAKFLLKTLGKDQGFTETIHVEQTNSRPVIQFINVSKLNAINGDQINHGVLEDSESD